MSIEDSAAKSLQGFLLVEEGTGTDFRKPEHIGRLLSKMGEVDLDKDLGRFGHWTVPDGNPDWEHTDARLLRNARLDSAVAKYAALSANQSAIHAMNTARRSFWIIVALLLLNAAQMIVLFFR